MTSLILFRLIAILEGISFLLLLGVAMPLKYIYHEPLMVEIVGMAHGVLFVMYCLLLAVILKLYALPLKVGAIGFVASLVPAGTFVFDRYIAKKAAEATANPAT